MVAGGLGGPRRAHLHQGLVGSGSSAALAGRAVTWLCCLPVSDAPAGSLGGSSWQQQGSGTQKERASPHQGLRPGLLTSTPSHLLRSLGQSNSRDQLCFKGRGTRPMGDAAELEAKGVGFRKGEEMGSFLPSTERVTKHFILSIKTRDSSLKYFGGG